MPERRKTQQALGAPLPGMPEWVLPAQPDPYPGDHEMYQAGGEPSKSTVTTGA